MQIAAQWRTWQRSIQGRDLNAAWLGFGLEAISEFGGRAILLPIYFYEGVADSLRHSWMAKTPLHDVGKYYADKGRADSPKSTAMNR